MSPRRVVQKRILVADDEPGVRDALKLLLALDEHTVTVAQDGVEAFDLASSRTFDLLITDYEMPRMDGKALAAKVRKLPASPPILMITAYGDQLGIRDSPVDAILNKPFDFEDLRRAIAQLLA